jgi:hypothetical protein
LTHEGGSIGSCVNRMQASELRSGDETGKSLFAVEERHRPHVPAVQAEEVEGEEEEIAAGDRGWSLLRAGLSSLRPLRRHNEAIQKRRACRKFPESACEFREPQSPLATALAEKFNGAAALGNLKAIPFDHRLMQPSLACGRDGPNDRQAGPYKAGGQSQGEAFCGLSCDKLASEPPAAGASPFRFRS